MSQEVLRPGPVIGAGARMQQQQRATLAIQLSNYATVTAALLRAVGERHVEPGRLGAQRARAREFVSVIAELEEPDASNLYETSELIPRRVWEKVLKQLQIPEGLHQSLVGSLDHLDAGDYSKEELARQAKILGSLAETLRAYGRNAVYGALEDVPDVRLDVLGVAKGP